MTQHSLKLYSKPPRKFTWRERISRMLRVEEELRKIVSSATKQGDPNG